MAPAALRVNDLDHWPDRTGVDRIDVRVAGVQIAPETPAEAYLASRDRDLAVRRGRSHARVLRPRHEIVQVRVEELLVRRTGVQMVRVREVRRPGRGRSAR